MIYDELVISISVLHYLLYCCGSRHLLVQSQHQKHKNRTSDMFQVNSNWTTSTSRSSVFLVNLQQIPHLMLGFYCWLSTCNCPPGIMVCETQNLLTSQYKDFKFLLIETCIIWKLIRPFAIHCKSIEWF